MGRCDRYVLILGEPDGFETDLHRWLAKSPTQSSGGMVSSHLAVALRARAAPT